tara:strand:- start:5579 stop:6457 length:879 start_codon:yes stop_codon:yes gene_type:complete
MSLDTKKHIFWLEDYKVLFENDNYTKFIPRYKTTRTEQLNAISRFSIYMIILLLAFNKNQTWLYLPIILLISSILFYYAKEFDELDDRKELRRILQQRANDKQQEYEKALDYGVQPEESKENVVFDEDTEDENNSEIEGGYYDSSGNLHVGTKQKPPKYSQIPPESLYTVDELMEFDRETARRPTRDNPFMNPNITDYNNGDPPKASNIEDEEIIDDINQNFNKDLYRNIEDLFDKKNSQRQFYTIPSTSIPNNQTEFANFAYRIPYTCKEDQHRCLRYEDLRTRRIRGNMI